MQTINKRKSYQEFKNIIIILILSLFIRVFIFSITYVKGESMYPTLNEGDRLVLSKYKTSLNVESFKKGDIVVFKAPSKNNDYIKRIIASEGDTVNIIDGKVYINKEIIKEDYLIEDSYTDPIYFGQGYKVPEGMIFVVGDNRKPAGSYDSRSFGAISINSVKGKVSYRLFPQPGRL